ncbi:MAG: PSD1 domain-containing protein, partial [Planctomycetes bacterium]|nr:PSD1 domain-containing protein [Planctomycetota bacterium]
MISLLRFSAFVLLAFSLPIVDVAGADRVDFQGQILPIFRAKCFDCHGPQEQEGQLRLDAKAAVFRGGISGPSVVAGKSSRSPLLLRLTSKNDDERMPLDEEPLTAEEIQLIRRWIDEGAVWPDGVGATVSHSERHWAYVLPKRWPFPKVIDSNWVNNPLDLFVLARLESSGLKPSPRADGARLLRRAYLDLIGLPPSVEDLDAFLNDSSQLAYENAVDRLLASPHYGERWARPWLDLARYADSNGYQADQYRNVWPYRDWVIRALNDDMPFSQFTIEQIAGDLLPGSTVEQKIATGFHRLTTCNVEAGVDPEENRVNQVIDRVNTTGTVWLGTTVECAQCHNHKYDPFTQRDYYRLFAYFNNTPLEVEGNGVQFNFVGPKFSLPLTAEQQVERGALKRQMDERNKQLATAITTAKQQIPAWEKQVAAVAQQAPKWHVLKIESFRSSGGASHTILDDHSVLVGGAKPDKDSYAISTSTKLSRITGFKIETLTDPSLPGKGPGRHDVARPNFVLHEFQVTGSPAVVSGAPSESLQKISLHSAAADFSQKSFPVANAIDGNTDTAWAINPQFGKPHWATFFTTSPFGFDGGTKLTFTLDQHFGGGRTIGRLRISAMTGTPGKHQLSAAIAKILSFAPAKRNAKQRKQIENHFINQQPQIKKLRMQIAALQKQVDAIKPVTTLVMVEQVEHRKTHVFKRGSFLTKGEEVTVGTPRALPRLKEMPRNRLGLARWLVDSSNPLTSRVAVNRWWTEIFGQGIVHTIEDFGTQGDPPTHPRLLDWLACELVDSGWSMKHIH